MPNIPISIFPEDLRPYCYHAESQLATNVAYQCGGTATLIPPSAGHNPNAIMCVYKWGYISPVVSSMCDGGVVPLGFEAIVSDEDGDLALITTYENGNYLMVLRRPVTYTGFEILHRHAKHTSVGPEGVYELKNLILQELFFTSLHRSGYITREVPGLRRTVDSLLRMSQLHERVFDMFGAFAPKPHSKPLQLTAIRNTAMILAGASVMDIAPVDWRPQDETPFHYMPIRFTHPSVMENDSTVASGQRWAHPMVWDSDPAGHLGDLRCYVNGVQQAVQFEGGQPMNPTGRTGVAGRGILGKYGPNIAADPIVTRYDPATNCLQMVAIQRSDTKQWAIPGGMVEPGEQVSETLKREFQEEARNISGGGPAAAVIQRKMDELFARGGVVTYRGIVDDPRNTDNAWMETTCVHFHIDDVELARSLTLGSGSDAINVKWLNISRSERDFVGLYASHKKFVEDALRQQPKFSNTVRKL